MATRELRKAAKLEVSGRGPVHLQITAVDQSTAALTIGVNYSLATVPPFQYDADYCDVVRARTGVSLIFGKLRAGSQALRTKIEIAFSDEYFVKQVWGSSRALHETTRKYSARHRSMPSLSGLTDPDKVQSLRANNVFMAVLAGEAVLDFYYISPGEIHLARTQKKPEIALDPVVRVATTTPLLFEFFEKAALIVAVVKEELDEQERREEEEEHVNDEQR